MQRSVTALLFVVLVLFGTVLVFAGDDDTGDGASLTASAKGLRKIMQSSIAAISRLHMTVKKYQQDRQLTDAKTQALLSDCSDLTDDSRDVLDDSMSILVKLVAGDQPNSTNSASSGSSEEIELLKTNLSAALTDITTCTDGLHDEVTDDSVSMKKAVSHIDKQATKASELLSKALNITASASLKMTGL